MSKSEILAAIAELRTSISKLQTSFDSNLQTTNPSPPPPITPAQYPHLLHRTHSTSLLPIRRLSPSEIEEKNDRGLCYNCDQTWSDTHRCRSKYLILLGADDEDDFGDPKSPDFTAEVEVTVKNISSLRASEQPPSSPHPFTGLDPLSLLPPVVLQPPPPPPTPPRTIPPPPTEPPPNVMPSPAKPPPPPITPSTSPPPILGSQFWLLVGWEDEIVADAFGPISVAIADVLTVGVASSVYPSRVVFAGQEVQLCGEPPPDLLGIPNRSVSVSVRELAWIILVQVFGWNFCRAHGHCTLPANMEDIMQSSSTYQKIQGQSHSFSCISPHTHSRNAVNVGVWTFSMPPSPGEEIVSPASHFIISAPAEEGKSFSRFMVDFLMGGVSAEVFKTAAAPSERVKLLIQNRGEMIRAAYANAKTTLEARKGVGKAFIVAFRSGVVRGFLLAANGQLVLYITINLFKIYYGDDWEGLFEAITGYGLGGSSMALLGRDEGGIYTKTADVGADLVGNVERNISEDDPRNPAVIADNVGVNVGDIAGVRSDLFGSYAETSCVALAVASISSFGITHDFTGMCYPLLISSMDILVGIAIVTWTCLPSSFTIFNFGVQKRCEKLAAIPLCLCGLWAGLIIEFVIDYYTNNAYSPVQDVADSCRTGAATLGTNHRHFFIASP